MKVMRRIMSHSTVEREAPMLRLVTEQFDTQVARPPRSPGGIVREAFAVRVPLVDMGEAEVRGMKVVRRVLRLGVVAGMMATAWQAGILIGAL
jgi:hypothetical protein